MLKKYLWGQTPLIMTAVSHFVTFSTFVTSHTPHHIHTHKLSNGSHNERTNLVWCGPGYNWTSSKLTISSFQQGAFWVSQLATWSFGEKFLQDTRHTPGVCGPRRSKASDCLTLKCHFTPCLCFHGYYIWACTRGCLKIDDNLIFLVVVTVTECKYIFTHFKQDANKTSYILHFIV